MNRRLRYKGINVAYNVTGKGRPLVFIHGYLETGEIWQPLSSILSGEFKIITVDLPGHGNSGVKGELHTMEFLADAVRKVISDAGESRVMMVGHSLGGYVTLAFAELWPEQLAGYVLFHSHPYADSPEAVMKRNREIAVIRAGKKNIMYPGNIRMMFARNNLQTMSDQVDRSREIASHNSEEGIIALLNGMIKRPSRKDVVESGKVPLLWILGRNDQFFTPEKAVRDIILPQNAEIAILEKSGHLGFIEETEKSALLLRNFAGRLDW